MEQVAVIPKILVLTIWNCTTWVLQRWLRRPFVGETTVMISSWSIVASSIEVWALRAQKCRSPWKKFISLVQRELRQAGQMLLLMGVHWIRSLVFSYMLLLVVNNCEKWRTPTFKASSSSFFFSRFCVCDWETIKDAGVGLTQRAWKVSLNLRHRIAVMKVAQGSRNSKLCMDGLFSGWKQSGHGPSVVV